MPEIITINAINIQIIWIILGLIGSFLLLLILLPRLIGWAITIFSSTQTKEVYQKIIAPYYNQLSLAILLILGDLFLLTVNETIFLGLIEILLGITIVIFVSRLGYKIFQQIFNTFLLDAAVKNRGRFDSELLIISKFFVNAAIILIVVFIFAQVHQINLIGLFASIGLVGLAISHASEDSLKQLFGTVFYI